MSKYIHDEIKRLKLQHDQLKRRKETLKQDYNAKMLKFAFVTVDTTYLQNIVNKFENMWEQTNIDFQNTNTSKVEEDVILIYLEKYEKIIDFIKEVDEYSIEFETELRNEIKLIGAKIDHADELISETKQLINSYQYKLFDMFE